MSALQQPRLTRDYLLSLSSSKLTSAELVECLSDLESHANIDSSNTDTTDTTELLADYYCLYFFALFLDDDLNEARFLVQRTPDSLAAQPSLIHAQSALQALYTISPESLYSTIAGYAWSPIVSPLKDRFVAYHRQQTFDTFSRAYTSLSPKHAAAFLGYADEKIDAMVKQVEKEGWKFDSTTGVLKPDSARSGNQLLNAGKDHRIQRLTALATHLTDS